MIHPMVDIARREIGRALAGVRSAVRAIQSGLSLATRIQRANGEGLAGETLADMELFQQFGFTSAPPDGAQLIVLPLGGRTSAAVVVATEHGVYRFHLNAKGEAALYNQWGDLVHMRQDRTIHIIAGAKVEIDAPLLQVNGEVHATGSITSDQDVFDQGGTKSMAGMRAVYNGHTHPEPDGTTSAPAQAM